MSPAATPSPDHSRTPEPAEATTAQPGDASGKAADGSSQAADGSTTTDSTAEGTTADGTADATPADPREETKRRMQEALARKQGRQGESHLGGGDRGPHGSGGPAKSQRTFRRKSG
ncbi:MAG: DUF5302 domain-containing protein [Actinomycetes bacterium]